MNDAIPLNPNRMIRALGKPPAEFTKQDLVRYIERNDVRIVFANLPGWTNI